MDHIGLKEALVLMAGCLLVWGCDSVRGAIGLDKQAPDEFAVVTRAPLAVPPDFNLRPPAPGAKRPQEESARDQARDVLLKNSGATPADAAATGKFSPGEAALLSRAGALHADPSIRGVVDRENTKMVETAQSVFDKVFFWQKVEPPGTIVDPEKESRRLRENSANGDPPNKGDVPIIKRRERGFLEGLF